MAAKFTDKLAEQAVEQALDSHAEAVQRQRELYENKKTVEGELQDLDAEILTLTESMKNSRIPAGTRVSVAEIEKLSCDQGAQLEVLKTQHAEKTRKLRLYKTATQQVQQEITLAKNQIDKTRATLAASFERHILASAEVKKALGLLRQSWAVWGAALGGGRGHFNTEAWSGSLAAKPPTGKDFQNARELMRREDD
jgi:chromosome segregation ATPase